MLDEKQMEIHCMNLNLLIKVKHLDTLNREQSIFVNGLGHVRTRMDYLYIFS